MTPSAARFAEWLDATARANDPRISDAETAAHVAVAERAAERLARTRASCLGDTALKLRVFAHESAPGGCALADRLLRSAIADLDRLGAAA